MTSPELLTSLLEFIQGKFYQGRPKAFAQDKRRLLDWVILWPARWLNTRGVTLPAERYRQIFTTVILDALRCGNTGSITYLPAYLAKVVQSHFDHHGDEIYDEAKSMRNLVENALLVTGKLAPKQPDPVAELATAAALLKTATKKRPVQVPTTRQLGLF